MAIGTPAPFVKFFVPDNNGEPAAGYQLFTYAAGTTTKVTTHTDSALSAANTNPIILDAAGRASIYLAQGSYKFVLATPTDTDPPTSPVWTEDNVDAAPAPGGLDITGTAGEAIAAGSAVYLSDGSGAKTVGRWYKTSAVAAYSSSDAPQLGWAVTEATGAASTFTVRLRGKLTTSGKTAGVTYYLDNATAGAIGTSGSIGVGYNLVPFAVAESATSLLFPVPSTPSLAIKPALKTFGYVTGAGNNAGGADTQLAAFDVTLPANYLADSGDSIILSGWLQIAANANAKTLKIKLGGGTLTTIWSSSANVANHVAPFQFVISRDTVNTSYIRGYVMHGAASGGAASNYVVAASLGAVNFAADQTIAIFGSGNGASDVLLSTYMVYAVRGLDGTEV